MNSEIVVPVTECLVFAVVLPIRLDETKGWAPPEGAKSIKLISSHSSECGN